MDAAALSFPPELVYTEGSSSLPSLADIAASSLFPKAAVVCGLALFLSLLAIRDRGVIPVSGLFVVR